MKKHLFSLFAVFAVISFFGQSIPNGGFESWTISSYENPKNYGTSNYSNSKNVDMYYSVTKTTDAYHGSYAIKLTSVAGTGTNVGFAWLANGQPGVPSRSGIPYSQKPTGIRFYYKSNIILGDTAIVVCFFRKNGIDIGYNLFKIDQTKTAYTLFTAPINLPVNPDTLVFAAASSMAFLPSGFKGGNSLQLDSISFTGVMSQPLGFNGDFEQWDPMTDDKLNNLKLEGDFHRSTDIYSGNYAVELQTKAPDLNSTQVEAGRLYTDNNAPWGSGGIPYSTQIDTLVFFYKYLPADPNDKARVYLWFKKNGFNIAQTFSLLPISASYTQVTMPFNAGQTPDSINFSFESSNYPYQLSYVGSDLKLDNLYLKSQRMPISKFIAPPTGCVGQPVQLMDDSDNMPNAWGWIMPGGVPGSSTAQNPVVTYYGSGTKTITMVSNNQFGAGTAVAKTITINIVPSVASTSSITPCGGSNVVLMASGAGSYTWSTGQTTSTISVNPPATTIYTVVGETNGCQNTAVGAVIVPSVPKPDICMVTVDSANVYNEIYWDKAAYPMLDSMIIYREVIANTYKRIGAVSKNALSMWVDTARTVGPANGDPNISTYRYKIQVRDTCGQYGPKSNWHNTVYFTHSAGTFFWTNNYMIEGPLNPVQTYSLMVCQNPTVSPTFSLVGTTTGNQSTLNDPFYTIYSATADWRVEADLGYLCMAAKATVLKATKSRSNIQNNRLIGIKELDLKSRLNVYPNPAHDVLKIESALNEEADITLTNMLGQVVYRDRTSKDIQTKTIDVSTFSKGVYVLTVNSSSGRAQYKVTVE